MALRGNRIRLTDLSISKHQYRRFIKRRMFCFTVQDGEGWETRRLFEVGRRCAEGKAREGVPLSMRSARGGSLIDVFSYVVYSAS